MSSQAGPQAAYASPPMSGRFLRNSNSVASMNGSEAARSISEKYSLPLDASIFNGPEADDRLHTPDPKRDHKSDMGGTIFTGRGLMNLGCIAFLGLGILTLFAGYPIISYFSTSKPSFLGGFNIGGINASGQVPDMPGNWGLIDLETPKELHFKTDYINNQQWELVFSDEFNTDGRSFYPGDDPYWEAVDLHYWQTNNLEWYDPKAITTRDGALEITLSAEENHNLSYTGGMMSTWNKFCFTGGLVEVSVTLPGANNIRGLWPAVWTMGNLGRAGYGGSLDGMWPYSYDSCDVGTVKNQTVNGLPVAATVGGDKGQNGILSFLPGQRLSRCTCPGESHPGPVHQNGEYVGRSAPEIDIFEAQIGGNPMGDDYGAVSQSCQFAPFNQGYHANNQSFFLANSSRSEINSYEGGVFQQATSVVTATNQAAYELTGGEFSTYGFQYKPGVDGAYISWITDGTLAWTLQSAAVGPDNAVEINQRLIPSEPMYLIANLGMSLNFGSIDFEHLTFPAKMRIDWIRVYQDPNAKNVGCDPDDFPTAAYIAQYEEAYTNPLLTTWVDDFKQVIPKNKFLNQC